MKTCKDLPNPHPCCLSCHEDEEQGYATMSDYETRDGKIVWLVCCKNGHKAQEQVDEYDAATQTSLA